MKRTYALLLSISLFACSPRINNSIGLGNIPIENGTDAFRLSKIRVAVAPFTDNRTRSAIGNLDGKEVEPSFDVGQEVKSAFEHYLTNNGVKIEVVSSPIVRGNVVDWSADLEKKMLSKTIRSTATIEIDVLDDKNRVVYAARYSGSATREDPFMSEGDVKDNLAASMGEALQQMIHDPEFVASLTKNQT